MIGQGLAKLVEIDGEADSALIVSSLSHAIGEQCTNFCNIVLAKVRAVHFQLIHAQTIHTSICSGLTSQGREMRLGSAQFGIELDLPVKLFLPSDASLHSRDLTLYPGCLL